MDVLIVNTFEKYVQHLAIGVLKNYSPIMKYQKTFNKKCAFKKILFSNLVIAFKIRCSNFNQNL